MIVVTVELWPKGNSIRSKIIGKLLIANNGKGTMNFGNYDAVLRESAEDSEAFSTTTQGNIVKDYPRKRGVWPLIKKVLEEFYHD